MTRLSPISKLQTSKEASNRLRKYEWAMRRKCRDGPLELSNPQYLPDSPVTPEVTQAVDMRIHPVTVAVTSD
ncbi:hypothetical protein ACLKA6_008428 [Drosophila palustris]